MPRVTVVHHDLDLAGQEADSLRRYGYDVIEYGGQLATAARSEQRIVPAWAADADEVRVTAIFEQAAPTVGPETALAT